MKYLVYVLFLFVGFNLHAGNLENGINALKANKRKEAISHFEKALTEESSKADANLGLMYTYWTTCDYDKAFTYFNDLTIASDNPYPYIYGLWSLPFTFAGSSDLSSAKITFLNKLISDSKAPGTLKLMAYRQLGEYYEAKGDFKNRDKMFNQIQTVDKWQVLGTFDNISGSGFNKDWGALEKKSPSDKFKNKINADVSWYTPPFNKANKWFHFDYYFNYGNSIMYAQSFVSSETDQEVVLRAGCSGSIKVWVNDFLVLTESVERNCDIDIYNCKVKLNKGSNRILVQIGESETNEANFLIRLTDYNGNSIPNLISSSQLADYKKATSYNVVSLPLFSEDFFEKKLKEKPGDFLSSLVYADALMRNDKVYEARKVLKTSRQNAEDCSLVSHRLIEAYARDNNVTDLTKEQEKVKTKDPESINALQNFYEEAIDREDYDEAEKILDKIISNYKFESFTDFAKLNLLSKKDKVKEVIEMAEELYVKYPANYELMNLAYQIDLNKSKDVGKSNKIVLDFLKKNYNNRALVLAVSNFFKTGNTKEGLKYLKERIQNFPYAIGFYNDLAGVYEEMQNYDEALVWNSKTLEFAPYIGAYHKQRAQMYQSLKREDEAKEEYKLAIKYSPTDYDARNLLRKQEGKKDVFENFAKTDVYDLYKKSPSGKDYPENHSIILLNELQKVVYDEGAYEQKDFLLVKVFNQTGIDNWKHYSISYNPYSQRLIIDKAEVIKPDGNKVKAETDGGTVVFTNLEINDAINLSYRIESYASGRLAQHFFDQFYFQYFIPSKISRFSLIVNKDKNFKSEVLNGKVESSTKDLADNMKMYTWESSNQAAIKSEPYMPQLIDFGTTLHISSIPDWSYVSSWYSDLASSKAKQDFELKETVADLLKDLPKEASGFQKANAFYNYIISNVAYSNIPFMHGPIIPQKASRTLATKLGDCKDVSTLFVAMCKEAGLKANLMLVDTRDNGKNNLYLPNIGFNHCIAQLDENGKKYTIELTDQRLSFASLPSGDIFANGLSIPLEGGTPSSALTTINPDTRVKNEIKRFNTVSFENMDMKFTRKTIKTGYLASDVRNDFTDLGQDEREKSFTRSIASSFPTPVKLQKLEMEGLNAPVDSTIVTYTFLVTKGLTELVGLKVFSLPWTDNYESLDFVSLEKREFNFDISEFQTSENYYEEIEVILPEKAVLQEKPQNANFSCSAFEYSIVYDYSKPGKIFAKRELKRKSESVSPSEYPAFKEFFNKLNEADTKKIAFK